MLGLYCKLGLKWHSLLFGKNRKLIRVFAVVYSAVEFCLMKGYLHAKIIIEMLSTASVSVRLSHHRLGFKYS